MLKSILDIEEPEDIDKFSMLLCARIFEFDTEGADLFYFHIVTPKGLTNILEVKPLSGGRGVFIVNEPTMEENIILVKKEIQKILEQCARDTWEEVALAINYYLDWEYYDPSIGICDYYLQSRSLKKQQFYVDIENESNK